MLTCRKWENEGIAATNIQRLDSNLPRDIRKEKGGPTIRGNSITCDYWARLGPHESQLRCNTREPPDWAKASRRWEDWSTKNTKQKPIQFEREDNRRFEANAPLISRRSVYPQRPTLIKHTMKYIIDRWLSDAFVLYYSLIPKYLRRCNKQDCWKIRGIQSEHFELLQLSRLLFWSRFCPAVDKKRREDPTFTKKALAAMAISESSARCHRYFTKNVCVWEKSNAAESRPKFITSWWTVMFFHKRLHTHIHTIEWTKKRFHTKTFLRKTTPS